MASARWTPPATAMTSGTLRSCSVLIAMERSLRALSLSSCPCASSTLAQIGHTAGRDHAPGP